MSDTYIQWPSVGSGAATWGTITGTLSNQTDLQTALNLLAPLASPTFSGIVSGSFSGPLTGNVTGNVSGTAGHVAWGTITGTLSNQTDLQTALNLLAPLASPTFTGTVTAPTFSGNLTGTVTGHSTLDLPLTGGTLTGALTVDGSISIYNPAQSVITQVLNVDGSIGIGASMYTGGNQNLTSVAIGPGAHTSSADCVAIGYNATVSSQQGTAVGATSSAGFFGTSLGYDAIAGYTGLALGSRTNAGTYSTVIGSVKYNNAILTDSLAPGGVTLGGTNQTVNTTEQWLGILPGSTANTPRLIFPAATATDDTTSTVQIYCPTGGVGLALQNATVTTGVAVATFTNAPVAGNPTGYLTVNINGTNRVIAFW
jgi:hypothetical protein